MALAIVVVMGSLVTWLRLGYLPRWTLINRDVGLVVMLGSCYLIASALSRPRLVSDLLSWFVVSASILNVVALVGALARYVWDVPNPMMYKWDSLRLAGFMRSPNSYGGYLAVALSVQVGGFVLKERLLGTPRWVEAANGIALLVGLLLTISRGSWLAALAGVLMVLLLTMTSLRRWRLSVRDFVAPALVSVVLLVLFLVTGVGGIRTAIRDWAGITSYLPGDRTQIYKPHGSPSVA